MRRKLYEKLHGTRLCRLARPRICLHNWSSRDEIQLLFDFDEVYDMYGDDIELEHSSCCICRIPEEWETQ